VGNISVCNDDIGIDDSLWLDGARAGEDARGLCDWGTKCGGGKLGKILGTLAFGMGGRGHDSECESKESKSKQVV
jgi:hypothetical protein